MINDELAIAPGDRGQDAWRKEDSGSRVSGPRLRPSLEQTLPNVQSEEACQSGERPPTLPRLHGKSPDTFTNVAQRAETPGRNWRHAQSPYDPAAGNFSPPKLREESQYGDGMKQRSAAASRQSLSQGGEMKRKPQHDKQKILQLALMLEQRLTNQRTILQNQRMTESPMTPTAAGSMAGEPPIPKD